MSCGTAGQKNSDGAHSGWVHSSSTAAPSSWSFNMLGSSGHHWPCRMLQGLLWPTLRNPRTPLLSHSVSQPSHLGPVHTEQKAMKLHLSMTELAKNLWPSLTYFRLPSDHKIFIFSPHAFSRPPESHELWYNLKIQDLVIWVRYGASEDSWVWYFRSASWTPLYQKSCELKAQVRSPSHSTHSGGREIG